MKLFTPLLILSLALGSTSVSAKNLQAYREKFTGKDFRAEANQRISRMRDLLGFADHQIVWKDMTGAAVEYPKFHSKSHPKFTSSFFKNVLTKAANQINLDLLFEVPPLLNPGLMPEETTQQFRARQNKIILEAIGDFSVFLNQVWVAARKDAPTPPVAVEHAEVQMYRQQVADVVERYIRDQQPKENNIAPIEASLGKLVGVDINDQFVTRLRFEKKINGQTIQLPVGLSLLVSLRTRIDKHFLEVLSFFQMNMEERAMQFYERFQGNLLKRDDSGNPVRKADLTEDQLTELSKLETSASYIGGKLQEALLIHQHLSSLSDRQLQFLIDLFLQLRKGDTPAETEISELVKAIAPVPTNSKTMPQDLIDYEYYRQEHEELYSLEAFIPAEASRKAVEESIKSDVRKLPVQK